MLLLGDRAGLGALKLTQAGDGMPLERRVMRPRMLQTMCADKWNTDFRPKVLFVFDFDVFREPCQQLDMFCVKVSFPISWCSVTIIGVERGS